MILELVQILDWPNNQPNRNIPTLVLREALRYLNGYIQIKIIPDLLSV